MGVFHYPQKQLPKSVLRKKCPENRQQIYRRSVIWRKLQRKAKQLYWNHASAWVFSRKFAAFFQTPFSKKTSGLLLLYPFNWIVQCNNRKIDIQSPVVHLKWSFFSSVYYFLKISILDVWHGSEYASGL